MMANWNFQDFRITHVRIARICPVTRLRRTAIAATMEARCGLETSLCIRLIRWISAPRRVIHWIMRMQTAVLRRPTIQDDSARRLAALAHRFEQCDGTRGSGIQRLHAPRHRDMRANRRGLEKRIR